MTKQRVAIVTDSTAYIPKALVDQHCIHVVPNVVNWGTQTFRDGVDISATEFFERMRTDPVMPTTAVASLGEFREIYTRAAQQAETVLGIHLSHKLSGTFAAAEQARAMMPELNIELVDSNSTAMALGFVALAAARAAEQGADLQAARQAALETIPRVGVVFTLETMEFLRRGGRIGGAAAFLGSLLDMKPILELRDGRVEPVERVRTKRKAVDRVLDMIVNRVNGARPVRLATLHAAAPDEAAALLEAAARRVSAEEKILSEVSPTVATHTGPGTVGLAFCVGA